MNKELERLSLLEKWKNFLDFADVPTKARLLNADYKEGLEQYRYLRTEIETALKEKEQQDGVLKTLREVIEFAEMLPPIEPNGDNGFSLTSGLGINIRRSVENQERKLLRQWVLETCFPKELRTLQFIKNKYEGIEKELGIDLSILFKALKQKFVYYKGKVKIELLGLHIKSNKLYLYGFVKDTTHAVYLSLEDYGKTWALTREELL